MYQRGGSDDLLDWNSLMDDDVAGPSVEELVAEGPFPFHAGGRELPGLPLNTPWERMSSRRGPCTRGPRRSEG